VADRDAEDRQHGVTDELLERTAELNDRLSERGQRAIDASPDLLGIEFVNQTGVADEVGEQGSDHAAIADLETVR
jgi:hypothetical protein